MALVSRMLFSEFFKIMANKVTFVGFRGRDRPNLSTWIRHCRGMLGLDFLYEDSCCLQQNQEWGFLCSRSGFEFSICWKNLLVVCFIYKYAGPNRSRIACVMLDPERIRIENLRNRIGSGPKKAESTHLHKTPTAQCLIIYITFMIQTFFIVLCLSINIFLTSLASTTTNFTSLKFWIIYQCNVYLL